MQLLRYQLVCDLSAEGRLGLCGLSVQDMPGACSVLEQLHATTD